MRARLLFCTLLAILLMAGCRSTRELGGSDVPLAPGDGARSYAATFRCEIDDIKATGMLRMKEDSIIWISVSKLIEVGRARLTPDSVLVYIKPTQRYLRGTYPELRARSGYHIDFQSVNKMLSDACRNRQRNVVWTVDNNGHADTVHITFTQFKIVNDQHYPITLPRRARPF